METFSRKVLWKYVNKLYRKPNTWIRSKFLCNYKNASEDSRNKWNEETYYVLKAFAKHNDAEAIKGIYRVGYPGLRNADDIWTETSLAGIAAEEQNYEVLQVLADCGIDVSWYGGFQEQYNWMFVIAKKDIRMCRIIAMAKNRTITAEAAAFIAEFCTDMVSELVCRADTHEKNMWRKILDVLDSDQRIINKNDGKMVSLQAQVETLVWILRYDDALALVKENPCTIDVANLWRCIFPEAMSDSYSQDYFYSDTVNEARNRLISTLIDNKLYPDAKVVENLIYSARHWWPRDKNSQNNYVSTLTNMLNRCWPICDRALLDVMWWNHDIKLTKHLLLNGPSNMKTEGLLHLMVDRSLDGDWPKVMSCSLGRVLHYDLWRKFCKEHNSYINDLIDVMKYMYAFGNLAINEQEKAHGMTALHVLCKEALPQALHMSCVKKLVATMIKVGADVNIKDNDGNRAYDYAKAKRAPLSILKLLHSRCQTL